MLGLSFWTLALILLSLLLSLTNLHVDRSRLQERRRFWTKTALTGAALAITGLQFVTQLPPEPRRLRIVGSGLTW